ncbi:hypothetical protein J6590_105248 [Homalodisca vitripennis]|nr:hypothetical protein J6590_105248 [Homalodisca vitripennis]
MVRAGWVCGLAGKVSGPNLYILFFWEFMKDEVYSTSVNSEPELRGRILAAFEKLRQTLSFKVTVRAMRKRARACLRKQGRQFENDIPRTTRAASTYITGAIAKDVTSTRILTARGRDIVESAVCTSYRDRSVPQTRIETAHQDYERQL